MEQQNGSEGAQTYTIPPSAARVRDLPRGLRPREEMDRVGAGSLPDAALLAILLRSGTRGTNVIDLSTGLIRTYGSLSALAAAGTEELSANVHGLGRVKAQILVAAFELARRLNAEAAPSRVRIRSPEDVARVLQDRARGLECEKFWALHLDARNTLKGRPVDITSGLLDASLVHPREVFREAIRSATAAVVVAHNHPSGDVTPSAEDIRITRQLVEAGRIIDIRVLDHIIVGRAGQAEGRPFLSMREEGLVRFDT